MSRNVVFKRYDQDQLSLLPPSYDDLVPKNHPVRIVNTIIDHLNIDKLTQTYEGGSPDTLNYVKQNFYKHSELLTIS